MHVLGVNGSGSHTMDSGYVYFVPGFHWAKSMGALQT